MVNASKLFPTQDCQGFDTFGRIMSGTASVGDRVKVDFLFFYYFLFFIFYFLFFIFYFLFFVFCFINFNFYISLLIKIIYEIF